ncbi:SRPBCC family protein [Niveibacterium sp. SC-1]|uniref:SRPBCC family protein n=1 Tax=Niveibacterium sp. SC-1 TaxID=3135646 RepID=UPI00311FE840
MRPHAQLVMKPLDDRTLVMTRSFDAPRALVFRCWTEPELLRRWLSGPDGWTFTVCEVDLRVGGAYRYVWHWEGPVCEPTGSDCAEQPIDMGMRGEFRSVDRPGGFVATECFDQSWYPGEAVVQHEFVELEGRTYYTGTVTYESAEALQAVLRSGMEQGVSVSYNRLDGLLAEQLTQAA